jgi:hypothetical protein
MLDTPDRLAELVQDSRPHEYCSDCLAVQLEVTEGAVRDAAQVLAIQRPGFAVVLGLCHRCGQQDNLLTLARHDDRDAWNGPR